MGCRAGHALQRHQLLGSNMESGPNWAAKYPGAGERAFSWTSSTDPSKVIKNQNKPTTHFFCSINYNDLLSFLSQDTASHQISRHFDSTLTQLRHEIVVALKQNGINNKVKYNNHPKSKTRYNFCSYSGYLIRVQKNLKWFGKVLNRQVKVSFLHKKQVQWK